MSLQYQIRLEGMREAKGAFAALLDHGNDLTPLADNMGHSLANSAVHRLAVTNVGPDGTPWPDSARTRARGGRTQYDRGSGGLAGSITHEVGARGTATEIGSNKPYAAMRQFGGTIVPRSAGGFLVFEAYNDEGQLEKIFARSVTQPARPYLGVSPDDADELAGLALDYFNMALAERSGG